MRRADKLRARFVLIVGGEELGKGKGFFNFIENFT